jgi:hypothetical protein
MYAPESEKHVLEPFPFEIRNTELPMPFATTVDRYQKVIKLEYLRPTTAPMT